MQTIIKGRENISSAYEELCKEYQESSRVMARLTEKNLELEKAKNKRISKKSAFLIGLGSFALGYLISCENPIKNYVGKLFKPETEYFQMHRE